MNQNPIKAHQVTKPMQLLAAWLAALIAIEGIFFTSAGLIDHPRWAAGLLVVSGVLAVPVFLGAMFLLQTKFRPQIQDDEYYGEYLKSQQEVQLGSELLRRKLREVGLSIEELSRGHTIDEVGLDDQETITVLLAKLRRDIRDQEEGSAAKAVVNAPAMFAVGKALMAEGRWAQAAQYFEQATQMEPGNWEAFFALGYCHGKSRLGRVSDLASLNAYSEAIRLAPEDLRPNLRARLLIYHAAILKRLGNIKAAEEELHRAEPLASETEEIQDLTYHLSSIYAMTDRHDLAIQLVSALRSTPYLASIWSHLDDYYKEISGDPRFLEAIREPDHKLKDPEAVSEMLKLRAAR